jgi:hypothetical protein
MARPWRAVTRRHRVSDALCACRWEGAEAGEFVVTSVAAKEETVGAIAVKHSNATDNPQEFQRFIAMIFSYNINFF